MIFKTFQLVKQKEGRIYTMQGWEETTVDFKVSWNTDTLTLVLTYTGNHMVPELNS